MIKGIIYDLDGMYFTGGKENFIKALSDKYKVESEVAETLFISSDLMANYKRGKLSDESFWNTFINKLQIKASKDELVELLVSGYKNEPQIETLVKELHSNGMVNILCSNNFPARVEALNKKFLFLLNFDVKVFSYEVGYLKLEGTKMFEQVVALAKLPPEDILFIDNGEENVAHAKSFGFAALFYENFFKLIDDLNSYGIKT